MDVVSLVISLERRERIEAFLAARVGVFVLAPRKFRAQFFTAHSLSSAKPATRNGWWSSAFLGCRELGSIASDVDVVVAREGGVGHERNGDGDAAGFGR